MLKTSKEAFGCIRVFFTAPTDDLHRQTAEIEMDQESGKGYPCHLIGHGYMYTTLVPAHLAPVIDAAVEHGKYTRNHEIRNLLGMS